MSATSSPTRSERRGPGALGPPLLAAAAGTVATLAVHLRDPAAPGSWGVCPFSLLGGLDCPGCGGLRAVHALTHGDVVAAASSNLLLVVALPFALLGWALWLRRAVTGRRVELPPVAVTLLLTVVVLATAAFAVLRNLPAGAWLHS